MKVLILGGTGFFGKQLADYWPDAVIASRHKPESNHLYVKIDRTQASSLSVLAEQKWDIIYDQICFNAHDAKISTEMFSQRCGHYIMTSTMGVYGSVCSNAIEYDFSAENHTISDEIDYATGKRDAEHILSQSTIKNARVRFPVVLGKADPTHRFNHFIHQVLKGSAPIKQNKISIISSDCAANTLYEIGLNSREGAFNACSEGDLTARQIIEYLKDNRHIDIPEFMNAEPDIKSLFNRPGEWTIDNSKLKDIGINFDKTADWINNLIDFAVSNAPKTTSA
ncbi:MAG: hypothetical protein J0L77_03700 [Alphaproteobacteria bacterium]|nr:hypothetical protein [Alphaproteobacteria bacterium]